MKHTHQVSHPAIPRPGDTAFWTEAEGSPTFRVRCCCGWAKRVTSDAEADELLEAHTFAHELIARSAS